MGNNYQECLDKLIEYTSTKGYLTFEDIIVLSEEYMLSISDLDRISENLQLRGIIIYEEEPHNVQIVSEDYSIDYSRVDYDEIYTEVLQIDPSLEQIVSQIKGIPAPQHGETNRLIRQSQDGNTFARNRVIAMYLRNVLKIALSMSKSDNLLLSDAFSAGVIGLITGIERYNPDGFSVFHSYVSMYIRQAIQRECTPMWFEFYHPVHIKDKVLTVYKLIAEYIESDLNSEQLLSLIIDKTDLKENEIRKAIQLILSQTRYKESLERLVDNGFEIASNYCLEEEVERIFVKDDVSSVLDILTDKERDILYKRYGFDGASPMTLEEVGKYYNVTRERIRQIEFKAIKKIKRIATKTNMDSLI